MMPNPQHSRAGNYQWGESLLTERTQQSRYGQVTTSERISCLISVEQPFFCYGQFSKKEKHLKITFAPTRNVYLVP